MVEKKIEPPAGTTATLIGLPGARRRDRDILLVNSPRLEADGFALRAIEAVEQAYRGDVTIAAVHKMLGSVGATEHVAKVTAKLDAGNLDRIERVLLSIPGVYAGIVSEAIVLSQTGDFQLDDTTALVNFVRRTLGDDHVTIATSLSPKPSTRGPDAAVVTGTLADAAVGFQVEGPRLLLATRLLDGALAERSVTIDRPPGLRGAVIDRLRSEEIPLRADRAEAAIFAIVDDLRAKGPLYSAVEIFAQGKEIDPIRFTDSVRKSMVAYLQKLGLVFTREDVAKHRYDEYLAIAYNHAISSTNGSTTDPIDAVRQLGAQVDWDFTVDEFDTVEEQGVIPENILAAGALDYVYCLGETLGMFQLADAVVLRWGSGAIDLEPGETPARLYRYWKLRDERTSPEERAMLYTRVLQKGDGQLIDGMVANTVFPELWGSLMQAVADYIAKTEEKVTTIDTNLSKQRIYQATKQLQFNLTQFLTGMAQMQVTEMYHHLQEARAILEDPQIVDYFGSGRRKNIWTVIERASKEWFDYSPNISAIRSLAIDGNRVFKWIASFDQATVTDEQFNTFRDAAESWILAQATAGGEMPVLNNNDTDADTNAPENGNGTGGDDFDSDWDQ